MVFGLGFTSLFSRYSRSQTLQSELERDFPKGFCNILHTIFTIRIHVQGLRSEYRISHGQLLAISL